MSIGQKQQLDTLRFFLYDRPLHPELFDIYYDEQVFKSGYEAQIWVTGCSHVVGFYRDGFSLLEAVAGADDLLPQRGMLLELPLRGERDHERKRSEGINYMMNFQVEQMSELVYSKTHHDLAKLGNKRGVFVPFPVWRSRGQTPFTYIDYEAKPNELHLFAFHAFPDDLTVVKTQSIFELG